MTFLPWRNLIARYGAQFQELVVKDEIDFPVSENGLRVNQAVRFREASAVRTGVVLLLIRRGRLPAVETDVVIGVTDRPPNASGYQPHVRVPKNCVEPDTPTPETGP